MNLRQERQWSTDIVSSKVVRLRSLGAFRDPQRLLPLWNLKTGVWLRVGLTSISGRPSGYPFLAG
jgi:hypothetical protein